ncbi:MAG: radical SAM protein [archaeon]
MQDLNRCRPCKYLWFMPIVAFNGDVTVCCNDNYFEYRLGNLKDSTLEKLWTSEKIEEMRMKQIRGHWDEIRTPKGDNKCSECMKGWGPPQIEDQYVINYLEDTGRQGLIPGYLHRFYPDNRTIRSYLAGISRSDLLSLFPVGPQHEEIIKISPRNWSQSEWEERTAYNNEDGFGKGYSFIGGKGKGFFVFSADKFIKNPEEMTVIAHLASPAKCQVSLFVNSCCLGAQEVSELSAGTGDLVYWKVGPPEIQKLRLGETDQLMIRLESENGLYILDQPIQDGLEQYPVMISLKKEDCDVQASLPFKIDTVLIELADHCNLNCIMCDQSAEGNVRHGHKKALNGAHDKTKGFIELGDFRKIIDDINYGTLKYNVLSLFWLGEPLIHPEFPEIINYVNSNRVNFDGWLIHTNGLKLDENVCDILLARSTDRDTLHISVDAATPETYSNIRKGGDFNRLLQNIETLLRRKSEQALRSPRLVFQFIVMEENKHEATPFVALMAKLFAKYNLQHVVADEYRDCRENTIFLRKEITVTSKQHEADILHKETSGKLLTK